MRGFFGLAAPDHEGSLLVVDPGGRFQRPLLLYRPTLYGLGLALPGWNLRSAVIAMKWVYAFLAEQEVFVHMSNMLHVVRI